MNLLFPNLLNHFNGFFISDLNLFSDFFFFVISSFISYLVLRCSLFISLGRRSFFAFVFLVRLIFDSTVVFSFLYLCFFSSFFPLADFEVELLFFSLFPTLLFSIEFPFCTLFCCLLSTTFEEGFLLLRLFLLVFSAFCFLLSSV